MIVPWLLTLLQNVMTFADQESEKQGFSDFSARQELPSKYNKDHSVFGTQTAFTQLEDKQRHCK